MYCSVQMCSRHAVYLNISMLEVMAVGCRSQFSLGFLQFLELPFVLLLDINDLIRNALSTPMLASSIHSDRMNNIQYQRIA